jgi:N-acetylneuraminic acid mutarotase
MSEARYGLAAAAVGDFVVFGGGSVSLFDDSWVVDLSCASKQTWFTARLSEPRSGPVATSVGNKVFFAGGYSKRDKKFADVVDIIEVPTADPDKEKQQ